MATIVKKKSTKNLVCATAEMVHTKVYRIVLVCSLQCVDLNLLYLFNSQHKKKTVYLIRKF